jgi:protein XagA
MITTKIKVYTAVIVLFFSQNSFAVNDPLLKGEGLLRVGSFYSNYSSVFDNDGERKAVPMVQQTRFFLSGEYGISNRFSVLFSGPNFVSNSVKKDQDFFINEDKKFSRIGDMEVGMRYFISEAAAWRAGILITQGIGLATDDQKDGLNTGNKDFKTSVGLKVAFRKFTRWDVNGTTGFTNRNNGFGDEFFASGMFNLHTNEKYNLALKSSVVYPFENGDEKVTGGYFGIYQNNAAYWSYQAEFTYYFNSKFGAAVEYIGYLRGQNISAQPNYSLQFIYHFMKNSSEE